jgi:hypothetical protein
MEHGMTLEDEQVRAKPGEGLPKWDQSKQQYAQRIGYCFDAAKRRIRKVCNLGKNFHAACARAIELRTGWDEVVANWSTRRPKALGPLAAYDWSKPVWLEQWMLAESEKFYDDVQLLTQQALVKHRRVEDEADQLSGQKAEEHLTAATKLDDQAVARYLARKALVTVSAESPFGTKASVEEITLLEAKDRYLKVTKARIGRGGGKGLKVRSYNTIFKNLHLVLGLTIAKKKAKVEGRDPIDPALRLLSKSYAGGWN